MTYDGLGNLLTVDGPLSGTVDTARMRYDAGRRVVGTVSPDPDGSGALKHRAVRNTYTNGLLTEAEQGNVNSQSDSDWAAFSTLQETRTEYDANSRPVVQKLVSGSTIYALGQTSYDALGRPECTAQRMNSAAFGSLPSSACTLGTAGSFGPDRIVKTFRDAAGQVTRTTSALGVTGVESDDVTTSYTSNGLVQTVTDAENNKTTYVYDGHDRLSQTQYPSATKGAGTSNSSDYEQPTYENTAGGTRTSGTVTAFRNRAGESIGFTVDALGRLTAKDLPGSEPDVAYTYDLLGRMTGASQTGNSLSFTYDALGRNLTQAGPQGTVTSTWDIAGRRTRIAHPDGFYVDQEYLVTGEPTAIRENGATSGAGVLATYAWGDLGRRSSLTRGDGSVLSYSYDAVSRLTSLADNLVGTAYDQTLGFGYTPASQIASNTRSNDSYAWTGHYNLNRSYTANGRNQYTAVASITPTYDSKGNLTSAGSTTYTYSSENLLTSASGGIALAYDPAKRLYQTSGGSAGTTRFGYDGPDLIAEYNSSNALLRRYVNGPGADEPLVWYEGSGTSDRRFLHADERGSIVAVTNSSGTTLNVNGYDEYGIPSSGNVGRFQYTGQTWLPELGMYYYKARIYSPTLGRFLQTDPIGYGGGMNVYAYVGMDPVNFADPSGLCAKDEHLEYFGATHIGTCVPDQPGGSSGGSSGSGGNGSSGGGGGGGGGGSSGSGSGSGGLIGGPDPGGSCAHCIPKSDPGSQASIKYWRGYYENNVWVSTEPSFFSFLWSSIKNASGLDWLVAIGFSAGLGEEDHATTSDTISTEIEITVTATRLERDAAVALIKANPGINVKLGAVWGSRLADANAAVRNGASRPAGVSTEVLQAYRKSLTYQIEMGRDTTGVAPSRLMLIDRWLKQ